MKTEYIVTKDWENSNVDPIELVLGDCVEISKVSDDISPWDNWIYCTCVRTQKRGWVPVQIIEVTDGVGTAKEVYTAKELTVKSGDVIIGERELNGWIWATLRLSEDCGWVPKENIE